MQPKSAEHTLGPPYFATTVGLAPREKFDYWHDVVCRNLVDLDYERVGAEPFEATFSGTKLAALNISRIQAAPHNAARTKEGIARIGSDSLVFNFVMSGRLCAEQDGRATILGVGEGAVCDAQRPYFLHFDEPFEIACIQVPRQALSRSIGGLQRLMAINFGQKGQICPIVFGYVVHLMERAPMLEGAMSDKISQNFIELLSAMLMEIAQAAPLPLSEYRSLALTRVKDMVERNLGNCDLDPTMVSSELKLSPRYINRLFETEDTSLSRYIWRRRLERTAENLRDPTLRCRSISLIAMDNGFNDLSHFSKAFRHRFDFSPREYRNKGAMDS